MFDMEETKEQREVEKKKLNSFQDYLDNVKKKRGNQLENGVPIKVILDGLRASVTSKTKTPTLDFKYRVGNIEVTDTFVFDLDNSKYIEFTIDRLTNTLELYGEKFEEFTDTKSVAENYQHLIGTQVLIEQSEYKGYPKYEVLATEKTSNID